MRKLNGPFWQNPHTPDLSKPLFHYTSIEAFISIIKNGEIWLTDSRCLNDNDDSILFKKICTQPGFLFLFQHVKDESTLNFIRELHEFYSMADYEGLSNRYVFSCSLAGDKSSFWLTDYADHGAGVCLQFNNAEISFFDNECRCDHNDPTANRKGFDIWATQYSIDYSAFEKTAKTLLQLIEDYLHNGRHSLRICPENFHKLIGSLHKNASWSHEKEIRFIMHSPYDEEGNAVSDNNVFYRKGKYGLLPYKKLYTPKAHTRYLNKVILGPKISNYQQLEIFTEFLHKHGFYGTEVVPSGLSIR